MPFISLKFLRVLSLDPQILDLSLSLFPRINCLRGSWLKWSSTILPAKGDSFLLGKLSVFVMLLPVSSPQAPGQHLSWARGGVQDLEELPREEYLGSNLFHMRLIWANAQPCDPWWSCLAVWAIVLVYSLESEVQTWSLPGPDHLCRSSSGGACIKDVA